MELTSVPSSESVDSDIDVESFDSKQHFFHIFSIWSITLKLSIHSPQKKSLVQHQSYRLLEIVLNDGSAEC